MASIISAGTTSGTALNMSGDTSGVLQLATNGTTTAITIDTNQRAAFVAGTAALPAITTTGDTNTGIFFPAADTIAFVEGGAEAMRINSSGYVGIGATVPEQRFQVQGATSQTRISVDSDGNSLQFWKDSTPTFIGSVGLSTPGGADQSALVFSRYTGSWSESMRITSSGNLLLGTTTQGGTEKFVVGQSTSDWAVYASNTNATTAYGIRANISNYFFNTSSFLYDGIEYGNLRFRVYTNGGIANYSANNSNLSDQREKKDIELAPNYLNKICQIPVKTFFYNQQTDTEKNLGAIAQDVQAICPELVTESNWGTEEEPKMRLSIYQTDLQYALMKSIQELKAELDELKAKVNA